MVVITYDISDEKRLRKIAKLLETYGVRTQRSIFELDISLKEAKKIVQKIEDIMDRDIDSCFFISN